MTNLSLTEKELPAIKDWEVGEEYELTVKVKLTMLTSESYDYSDYDMAMPSKGNEKKIYRADFAVKKVSVDSDDVDSMSDSEFEGYTGKVLSNRS